MSTELLRLADSLRTKNLCNEIRAEEEDLFLSGWFARADLSLALENRD